MLASVKPYRLTNDWTRLLDSFLCRCLLKNTSAEFLRAKFQSETWPINCSYNTLRLTKGGPLKQLTPNRIYSGIVILGLMIAFQNCSKSADTNTESTPITKADNNTTSPLTTNPDSESNSTPTLPDSIVPTTAKVQFTVVKNLSGTQNALTLSAKVTFATEHVGKVGSLFVGAQLTDGRWFFLSNKQWRAYSENQRPPEYLYIATLTAGVHEYAILEAMDVKDFVGTKIYVGYGVANTVDLGWQEMLDTTRYKVVHTVE